MTKRVYDPFKQKVGEIETIQAAVSPTSGIDLKVLLDKTRTILYREINQLMQESSNSLLSKDSSNSLVNYIKLLKDLIKEENDLFDDMTDEELKAIVKGQKTP